MYPFLFRFEHPLTGETVAVTTYAALLFLGAASGLVLATVLAPRRGLSRFDVLAAGLIGFAGGLLGARLLYVLLHARGGSEVWRLLGGGGLVWYGGLLGGAGAAAFYLRSYRVALPAAVDVLAPAAALGQAFGRVGCFTAGCCHGRPASGPLALRFPPGGWAPPNVPLHPVQLYEAAGLLLLAAGGAALVAGGWRRGRPGSVGLLYLGAYAALRLLTETLRGDDRGVMVGPLSASQALSLLLFAVAVIGLRLTRTPSYGLNPTSHGRTGA